MQIVKSCLCLEIIKLVLMFPNHMKNLSFNVRLNAHKNLTSLQHDSL